MANKTILGVKAVKSAKSGKVGYTYFYSEPFTAYENESAESCDGLRCGDVFAYTDYAVKPGDVVDMRYEPGYQGKAQLVDIIMIKPYVPAGK
mgnify:CR=1 FL=1